MSPSTIPRIGMYWVLALEISCLQILLLESFMMSVIPMVFVKAASKDYIFFRE